MSTKKQNFAAAFISAAEKIEEPPKTMALPALETKTRRVQLLLKPSEYEKVRRMAEKQRCSVNHVIETLIVSAEEETL